MGDTKSSFGNWDLITLEVLVRLVIGQAVAQQVDLRHFGSLVKG
jgi:hypothetical protein